MPTKSFFTLSLALMAEQAAAKIDVIVRPNKNYIRHQKRTQGNKHAKSEDIQPVSIGDFYLERWKKSYSNPSKVGLGIIGATNGETVFGNNASRAKEGYQSLNVKNGKEFLALLERYTVAETCIPKIIFGGHGWNSDQKHGGPGIPLGVAYSGFYLDRKSFQALDLDEGITANAIFMSDLQNKISEQKIKFCDPCLIEIHSCNISEMFASDLSGTARCQVVSARGEVSPIDTKTGVLDHNWVCVPGFNRYTPNEKGIAGDYLGPEYEAQ